MEITLLEKYGLDIAAYTWYLDEGVENGIDNGYYETGNDKSIMDTDNIDLIKFDRMCGMHDYMLYLFPYNFIDRGKYDFAKFVNSRKTLVVRPNKIIYGYIQAGLNVFSDLRGEYIAANDSHSFYIFSDDENAIVYNTCGTYRYHHVTKFKIEDLNIILLRLNLAYYYNKDFKDKSHKDLYDIDLYDECYNIFKIDIMFNRSDKVTYFRMRESMNDVTISNKIVLNSMYRIRELALDKDRPYFDKMIEDSKNLISISV